MKSITVTLTVVLVVIYSVTCQEPTGTAAASTQQATEAKTTAASRPTAPRPTATQKPDGSSRTKWLKGIGKLSVAKRGAGVTLERKNGKLDVRIRNVYVDNKKVKSLKDIDFEFIADENSTAYGIQSTHMEVKGTTPNNVEAKLALHMFMENGTITGDDGNQYDVQKGSLKFNVEINWPEVSKEVFLTLAFRCKSGTGGGKRIKGRGKATNTTRKLEGISPCNKARITFSPLYKNASQPKEMEEGYPKIVQSDEKGWAAVLLKFSGKNILYDPVAEVGDDLEEEIIQEIKEISDKNASSRLTMSWLLAMVTTLMTGIKYAF